MPRIIVVDDKSARVMDEYVEPDHLRDERISGQLMERLVWAISDAHGQRRAQRRRRRGVRASCSYQHVPTG